MYCQCDHICSAVGVPLGQPVHTYLVHAYFTAMGAICRTYRNSLTVPPDSSNNDHSYGSSATGLQPG